MTQISPKTFEKICQMKGWHPYIVSTILDFGRKPCGKYELAVREASITTVMPILRANPLLAPVPLEKR